MKTFYRQAFFAAPDRPRWVCPPTACLGRAPASLLHLKAHPVYCGGFPNRRMVYPAIAISSRLLAEPRRESTVSKFPISLALPYALPLRGAMPRPYLPTAQPVFWRALAARRRRYPRCPADLFSFGEARSAEGKTPTPSLQGAISAAHPRRAPARPALGAFLPHLALTRPQTLFETKRPCAHGQVQVRSVRTESPA